MSKLNEGAGASGHTPGPWVAVNDCTVRGSHGEPIASTLGFAFPSCAYHKENAQLIAAAPDLLAACKVLADHASEVYPHFESERGQADIAAARIAIAKAERGGK
jgi:hypothetical protein